MGWGVREGDLFNLALHVIHQESLPSIFHLKDKEAWLNENELTIFSAIIIFLKKWKSNKRKSVL